MQSVAIPSVRDELWAETQSSPGASLLNFLLERGGKPYLFAGAVRDAVARNEYGWTCGARDWDIGVSELSRHEFSGIMREAGGLRNRYGGYKFLHPGSCHWDVWRLEDTVGLLQTRSPFSLDHVLRSFVLSCNAIAFDFDTAKFLDRGALRSVRRREITVLEDPILHDLATFSAKAIWTGTKLSFSLHKDLQVLIRRNLAMDELFHEARKAYCNLQILRKS